MKKTILFLLTCLCFSLTIVAYGSVANIATRPTSWNSIKHVVLIILENTNGDDAIQQPYLKSLTNQGAYLSQYFAVDHPSEPNYLALVGGSTYGVTDDSNVTIDAMHLGDLLDAKGLTWKTYAEDYPGNCYLGESSGNYARKHNPFISFRTVQTNPSQCAKIVPGSNFFNDINANTNTNNLPSFSLYVPNILNDGHDTGVAFADKWLQNTFGPLLSNSTILKDTLFIITFDEDDSGDNKVYAVFVGAGVKAGVSSTVQYTHYSLLKTIEDIFQLASLCTNDASATEISDVWLP